MTLCGIFAFGLAMPKTVKADALPCTVMYLEQAKAQQTSAQAEVNTARQQLTAKQNALNALKASGITSGMEYINAVNEMETAQRNVEMKLSALTNANNFLKDCQEKYTVEDNASKAVDALKSVNAVQAAELKYKTAQEVANTAAAQVAATEKAIAGYKSQLATSPSVQSQIDSLTTQLATLKADYAAKQATADSLKLGFASSLNSNYASYSKTPIDYIYNRDDMVNYIVTDLNGDGKVDGNDYFIGVQYMHDGASKGVLYREDYGDVPQPVYVYAYDPISGQYGYGWTYNK